MTENKYIFGIWKFHQRVGNKDLLEVANEWAQDDRYVELYIRQVSKDQDGIGFVYKFDGNRESYQAFFDQTTDMLKRRFGNDLVGWDISWEVQVIKGIE